MSLRFRRSIKIAPGLKVNLNKDSVSLTAGGRGAHYTINSKGRKTASAGIPGTGLSYVDIQGSRSKRRSSAEARENISLSEIPSGDEIRKIAHNVKINRVTATIFLILFAIIFALCGSPIFYLLSGLCIVGVFWVRKHVAEHYYELMNQAEKLDLVQGDLSSLSDALESIKKEKNASIFFLDYDRAIEAGDRIMRKAPELSEFNSYNEMHDFIRATFSNEIDRMMKSDFESAYKHIHTLSTQKGIDSYIARYEALYRENIDKLSSEQSANLQSNLEKLKHIKVPTVNV